MSDSLAGETSNTAVSHCAVTSKRRDVLTKQVNAGQQTVVATEPSKRDGGSRELITASHLCSVAECRVQVDTSSLPTSTAWSPLASILAWYRASALRLLIAELGSLLLRIAHSFEIRARERRGYVGKVPKVLEGVPAFHSRPDRRAYMHHMRQTEARFPFLTIFDLHLVSRSWRGGLECSAHTCTEQNQNSHSSANPGEGHSILLHGRTARRPLSRSIRQFDPVGVLLIPLVFVSKDLFEPIRLAISGRPIHERRRMIDDEIVAACVAP